MLITWKEFKDIASNQVALDGAYIYRGQRDASWTLKTAIHRTDIVQNIPDVKKYIDGILPQVHETVGAWVGRTWNLSNALELAEFLAFLQHNGFPTPLLDWTFSPYIAAYFAFESVNHFAPQNNRVAIYGFNQSLWSRKYKQIYDVSDLSAHVSVLKPRLFGNNKLFLQQGCFTWSNVEDIEGHLRGNETAELKFLEKYEIAVEERPYAMRELSLMGVSAVQLMPSAEAACKKALEDVIRLLPVGAKGGS